MIPARLNSTRLPRKPLLEIAGKPLVRWVYERARQTECLHDLLVATDDEEIVRVVEGFDGKAVMTGSDHSSGTDRVAEIAASMAGDVFVNIQGDEPLISPRTIDEVCVPFLQNEEVLMTTARIKIHDSRQLESPDVVKVVVNRDGEALYFSRTRIPYPRRQSGSVYKHIGIYAYRRAFLQDLSQLEPSELELVEGLEQLRFLENGVKIKVVEVYEDSVGVDTIEDLERVRPLLENDPQEHREREMK